jgi:hypothetical protein
LSHILLYIIVSSIIIIIKLTNQFFQWHVLCGSNHNSVVFSFGLSNNYLVQSSSQKNVPCRALHSDGPKYFTSWVLLGFRPPTHLKTNLRVACKKSSTTIRSICYITTATYNVISLICVDRPFYTILFSDTHPYNTYIIYKLIFNLIKIFFSTTSCFI